MAEHPYDLLPVGVLTVTLGGQVCRLNTCLAGWLGASAESLQGAHVDSLMTRAGRVLYHTHLLPMVQLHGQVQELTLALQAQGQALHVLTSASLHGSGESRTVQLVLSPMRERLRLEAAMQRVQRAADSAPVLLFEYVLDPHSGRGRFAYASAGLLALYRQVPEVVSETDGPVWARVHEDDRPALMAARLHSCETGQLWVAQYRVQSVSGSGWSWHALSAQHRRQADGCMVWHGTVTDVTRQREMEQAERERDAAARASQAKSEFLARVSHELRTPLNSVIGFARLLRDAPGSRLRAEEKRRLGLIERSGHQLLGLINEVLDISRIEAGRLRLELRPVDLWPALQRVQSTLEPMTTAAGLRVTVECPAHLCVLADAGRLDQVLANLMSNAVKYNRPQGRIELTVAAQEEAVRIQVGDSGIGMSDEQMRELFQPFNRLGAENTATEGTGLGLVIARGLVEAMGGTLVLHSTPGQGTTAIVQLPRGRQPQAGAGPAGGLPAPRPAVDVGGSVLYVEDEPVNAILMQALFERLPSVALRIACNAAEAVAAVRASPPDLLLLDMHLPQMNGGELLAHLREMPAMRQVPAVAVTADAMPADIARALAQGFSAYWTKPIDVEQVLTHVTAYLGRAGQPGRPKDRVAS